MRRRRREVESEIGIETERGSVKMEGEAAAAQLIQVLEKTTSPGEPTI